MIDITEQPHCEECEKCKYFWENQDDEYMNCGGEAIICHEFISVKESVDNEH